MMMRRTMPCVFLLMLLTSFGAGCTSRPSLSSRLNPITTPPIEESIEPIAVVQLHGGSATVTRSNETDPVPDGLELMPGDTIQVTSGTIDLVYPDAGVSRLETGTVLTVLPDGEGDGSVFAQMELTAGSIWTRLERLLGRDERFSVSANGVVATVRGTAFGMTVVDGEAEVEVVESGVDVGLTDARRDARLAVQVMRVSAGEKMRIGAAALKQLDTNAKQRMVRKMSIQEKQTKGFLFAMKKIDEAALRGPTQRVRLKRAMMIPDGLKDRLDARMLERILRVNMTPQFLSPAYFKDRIELFEQIVSSTAR